RTAAGKFSGCGDEQRQGWTDEQPPAGFREWCTSSAVHYSPLHACARARKRQSIHPSEVRHGGRRRAHSKQFRAGKVVHFGGAHRSKVVHFFSERAPPFLVLRALVVHFFSECAPPWAIKFGHVHHLKTVPRTADLASRFWHPTVGCPLFSSRSCPGCHAPSGARRTLALSSIRAPRR